MANFLQSYFSPEKKAARIENELKRAILEKNSKKINTLFSRGIICLLETRSPQALSNFVKSYCAQVNDFTSDQDISISYVLEAVSLLDNGGFDTAALMLCDCYRFETQAIEILAKSGRVNDLSMRLSKGDFVDPNLLRFAVKTWENHQGDIRKSPAFSNILINIDKFAPESIPPNPHVREILEQYEDAAVLYAKESDLRNAARCYHAANKFDEAYAIYDRLGDKENASRSAEDAGDLEKALISVLNPERKINLLIRTERFEQAREFAAGLETPGPYFDLIKEKAKSRIDAKTSSHDFLAAIELADLAECDAAKREEILVLGRQHFDKKIASAVTLEEIRAIHLNRVKLEEKAGHYEDAAKIADEILQDTKLASLLYEKANLYNRAIETEAREANQKQGDGFASMRMAELEEKGGNLLRAAQLYESVGQYDKAYALYETTKQFGRAIECYLKTSQTSQNTLVRLYAAAGEYEKVVEIYMKAGSFSDLEMALSIATAHHLGSHIRVIQERISSFTVGNKKDMENCFITAKDEISGTYSSVIGIDFGTTNSVVGIYNQKNKKVEIIPNSKGGEFEPSFFGFDENNHPIFGETARLHSLTRPDCVIARVKRSLGEQEFFSVSGKRYRCEEIVASFLQHLRGNADAYLRLKVETRFYELLEVRGVKFPSETLTAFLNEQKGYIHIGEVVLSVPAYFNDNQKRATRDSAEIAGLRVRRLLHEPTAAALAYSYQKPYTGKLAVIDLGGGTLDISVVDIGEGVNDVQAIGGDTKLGGSDLDALLVQHAVKNIKEKWGIDVNETNYPAEMARLRYACENLKIELSSVTQSNMELNYFLNHTQYVITLTREELEGLCKPILRRIQMTIEKTLREYGVAIDSFLLVGNATKMPAIGKLAIKNIQANQLTGIDPGAVVATGAALEGAILTGDLKKIVVLDIVPYSLGVSTYQSGQDTAVLRKLIEKNSTIPIKKSEIFSTKADNQPNVHIQIYQGEASEPEKDYFLGDFILDGIPPAPAGTPIIEVTFDIGVDCILTVTAQDKSTGNQRSMKIERSIVLSHQEKQSLSDYFAKKEKAYSYEKELETTRSEISALEASCDDAIRVSERTIQDFFDQFHEKVENNSQFYQVSPEQVSEIQGMFIQKDQFAHGIPKYRDQLASIMRDRKQADVKHLDFSAHDIDAKLKDRVDILHHYKQGLENLVQVVEKNVLEPITHWLQILELLEPDMEKISPIDAANHHLTAGRVAQAKEILESLASGPDGLTIETFQILLKCYVRLGMRDEYRSFHKRLGYLFGMELPDFNQLNTFLKHVDDSIFLIQGFSQQHGGFSGSGFCISSNLVVTNRHVVEGAIPANVKIISKNASYRVNKIELDPQNDLAILSVTEALKPLRLGEFHFVEAGEQVMAVGFPVPGSNLHSENIYISRGIVNSIRKMEFSAERVIFVDAKIGAGMSGGPLLNDLGEVVGILTLMVGMGSGERNSGLVENQPIALPIHLVNKFIART